jgi:hypothetical protein
MKTMYAGAILGLKAEADELIADARTTLGVSDKGKSSTSAGTGRRLSDSEIDDLSESIN